MKQLALRLGALAALLGALGTGCGHTSVPIPVEPMDRYAFRQTLGGVRVAADPYFTVDRLRATFTGGEDFPEKGLLPVHLIVENRSPDTVRMDADGARLLRPDGRTHESLRPYDAFSLIKLGVGWWAIGGGVLGGGARAYQNDARQKDIEGRAVREKAIPVGEDLQGFLYFAIPDVVQNLAGFRLVVSGTTAGGRSLAFEIPIGGSREIPKSQESSSGPTGTSQPPIRLDQPTEGGVIIRSPK